MVKKMSVRKEKLEIAATIAEIVAAVGVIISLVYLAIQLNDSNQETRLQTYNNTLTLMHTPIWQMVENEDLATIIRVGSLDPEQLSEDEWFRFSYWWLTQFNMYEYLYFSHLNEAVVSQLWYGTDASWTNEFENGPGIRKAWLEWRHAYASPFQAYVDEKVRKAEEQVWETD